MAGVRDGDLRVLRLQPFRVAHRTRSDHRATRLTGRAVLALLLVAACGRDDAGSTTTRVDAELTSDIAGTGPGDSVRFGSVSGMSVLAGAVMLSGGRIAIADQSAQRIVIVDSTGRILHQGGRAGDGPGEYRNIRWIGRCHGDSLFVWDVGTERITVLDSTAKRIREFRPPPNSWRIACNDAGDLVTMASPVQKNPIPSPDAPELYTTVALLSASGDSVARIDSVPAGRNRPMAAVTDIARSRTGVLLGVGDSAVVEVFTPTGARNGVLEFRIPPRTPTQREYDAVIDSVYFGSVTDSATRARLRKVVAGVPMPDHPAVYLHLFADPAGDAWAIPSWPLDSVQLLYGVAPDGSPIGPVRVPRELHVIEIGDGRVLGWRADADGGEHVMLYRFGHPR